MQFAAASPFRNDSYQAPGSPPGGNQSRFDACFAETTEPCFFIGSAFVDDCGPIAPTGQGFILHATLGRNIMTSNCTAGGVYRFDSDDDAPNF